MTYQAAMTSLTNARSNVVTYVSQALENGSDVDMQEIRSLCKFYGCQDVFMGATLCVYAPGTVARFCIDLETLEVREIIEHK